MLLGYNPTGKTLAEVAAETGADPRNGFCVMILQSPSDQYGKELDFTYSVREILRRHPEVAKYKVKYHNNFFGALVLRVIQEV